MASIEALKDIPGYKAILKTVLKSQIQGLLQQLSEHTEEESVIITAGVNDGSLSHLGSTLGKGFFDDRDEIKSQFLGYCLKALGGQQQQQQRSSFNSFVSQNPSLEHRPEQPHIVRRPKPYDRLSSKNPTLQQRGAKISCSDQKDANIGADLAPLGFTRPKSPMPNEGTELSRPENSPRNSSLSYDASDLSGTGSERSVDSNATTVNQEVDNNMEYNEARQGNAMLGNRETNHATTVKQEMDYDLEYDEVGQRNAALGNTETSKVTTVKQEVDSDFEHNGVGQRNTVLDNAGTSDTTAVTQEVDSDLALNKAKSALHLNHTGLTTRLRAITKKPNTFIYGHRPRVTPNKKFRPSANIYAKHDNPVQVSIRSSYLRSSHNSPVQVSVSSPYLRPPHNNPVKTSIRSPYLRPQHNSPVQVSIRSPYQGHTNPYSDNSTSLNMDNINIKRRQVILEGGGEFEEGRAYVIRDNKGKATTRVWKNGDFVPLV